MVNTECLRARMKERGYTQAVLAKRLGLSQPNLCQKLNNKRSFSIEQMIGLSEALGIEPSEYRRFFTERSYETLRLKTIDSV